MTNHSFPVKAFDKNGKEIHHFASVEVPEPNDSDNYNFSFVGTAIDHLDNGNVIVEDGDSDCFEIEANRLEVYDESVNQLTDEEIELLKNIVKK